MNVINDNQIVDLKRIPESVLAEQRLKGKNMDEVLSSIYQGFTKDALGDVQKIRSDMLLQSFKKKLDKDMKESVSNRGKSSSQVKDSQKSNVGSLNELNKNFNSNKSENEDTTSNINLIERA